MPLYCSWVCACYTRNVDVNLHEPSALLTLYRKVVPSGKEIRLPSFPKTFGSTPTRPNSCTWFTPAYMKGEVSYIPLLEHIMVQGRPSQLYWIHNLPKTQSLNHAIKTCLTVTEIWWLTSFLAARGWHWRVHHRPGTSQDWQLHIRGNYR